MGDTKGRVLIVDDEGGYLALIKTALEENSFEGLTAETAEEGLRIAREKRPDLILLDLIMPGMNGIGLLRELKRKPEVASIPVIVLTGLKKDEEVEREAGGLGAERVIQKNWGLDQLMSLVSTRLA